MSKREIEFDNAHYMCEWMRDNIEYFGDEGVFDFNYTNNESPVTIITGDNASGKSFVRKIFQAMCAYKIPKKIECIHLSQEGRCQSGIPSAIIYGTEDGESTGSNTITTMLTTFKTSHSRENDHFIIFDEPEIGLSDEYSAGMGIRIKQFIKEAPDSFFGAVVISHNKDLIKGLLDLNPNHMNMSDDSSLNDIINREIIPNTDLESLKDKSYKQYMKIHKIQQEMKKKNKLK